MSFDVNYLFYLLGLIAGMAGRLPEVEDGGDHEECAGVEDQLSAEETRTKPRINIRMYLFR